MTSNNAVSEEAKKKISTEEKRCSAIAYKGYICILWTTTNNSSERNTQNGPFTLKIDVVIYSFRKTEQNKKHQQNKNIMQ